MNTRTFVVVATLAAALAILALARTAPHAANRGYDVKSDQSLGSDPNPTIRVLMHQSGGDAGLW